MSALQFDTDPSAQADTATVRPSRLRTVRYEPGLVAAPLAAAAVLLANHDTTQDVALWGERSWAIGYSPVLIAPLAVAVGVWVVMRQDRDAVTELFETVPVTAVARLFRTAVVNAALIGAGMLAGFLVTVVLMTGQPHWGHPDYLLIVTALAGTWAAVGVGMAVGRFLPHWLTVGLAALAVYLLQSTLLGSSSQFLLPMTESARTYSYWPVDLGLLRVLWLVLLGLLGVLLAATRPRVPLHHVVLCAACGLAAGSVATVLVRYDAPRPPEITASVCTGTRPQVCVHPAYSTVLDPIAAAMPRALEPLAVSGHLPQRVEQTIHTAYFDESSGTLTFNMVALDNKVASPPYLADVILGALNPAGTLPCNELTGSARESGELALAMATEQLVRYGQDPTPKRLAAVSEMLRRNWDALRTCTATPDDIGGSPR